MAAYLPDEGETFILNQVLKNITTDRGTDLHMGLFTNSTVSETTTYASITEPTGTGYARKTLTDASWTVSGTGTAATYAAQVFTATGTWVGNVYGYFIATKGSSPRLLALETISGGPYSFVNLDSISITPSITLA